MGGERKRKGKGRVVRKERMGIIERKELKMEGGQRKKRS